MTKNNKPESNQLLFTVKEASDYLSISRQTLFRLIYRGDFEVVRAPYKRSRIYIKKETLDKWIRNTSIRYGI